MKRQRAERGGRRAEAIAALWLQLKGWSVIGRWVRTAVGEVDRVARRGKILAFLEVIARWTAAEAEFSLDEYRLRRMAPAASALTAHYAREGDHIRIEAMFIVPRRLPRHMANVWRG